MILKTLLLSCVFILKDASGLEEGEMCNVAGTVGTCSLITKCPSAVEDIRNKKMPKICGFVGTNPVVCCVGDTNKNPTTTPKITTTPMYKPDTPLYVDEGPGDCQPIPPYLTSPKIGQKAFDKCIDYQMKYLYPCERDVTGELNRSNYCHYRAEELIIGNDAEHVFPHMAMLGYGDSPQSISWLCGGSIISDRFILTAAHCTFSRSVASDVKYILVGARTRSDASKVENIYTVKRIIRHNDYKPPSKYNDIALLETDRTIALSRFVVPACLLVGDPERDDRVLAPRWRHKEHEGQLSEIMQKVTLYKFPTAECEEMYPLYRLMKNGFDPETQTCYGNRTVAKDTCLLDGGSPIQIKSKRIYCMYVIVGVTSFGKVCGLNLIEPEIYTRVAQYVPWIESVVWP